MRFNAPPRILGCFLVACLCLSAPALGEADELFTLDGTRLVVHEGVERITYDEPDFSDLSLRYVTELTLPSSLRVIEDYGVFYMLDCKKLTIPEGVEHIGKCCFTYGSMASISLPATLREVCAESFSECYGVSSLTVADASPYYKAVDNVLYSKDGSTLVYYPSGKRDTHFDVPAGVRVIAERAFENNLHLQTISLPTGLHTIQNSAFSGCGRLNAVSAPLTLRAIGDYAFCDCVSLERIALRETINAGEEVFYNCPLLKDCDQWKSAEPLTPDNTYTYEDYRPNGDVYAVLSPESARGFAAVYAMPSEYGPVLGHFACGSTVKLLDRKDGWAHISFYEDTDDAAQEGYVRENEVSTARMGETLFKIASVRPRNAAVRSYNGGATVLPLTREGATLPPDCLLIYYGMEGQWCNAAVRTSVIADGEQNIEEEYYHFFRPSDLVYTRQKTGDHRTLGVVVSADQRDRLHLRDQPDKNGASLGKYFSGTQVEILGEGEGWYHVRVDFTEGYMMSKFVEIVPQEE